MAGSIANRHPKSESKKFRDRTIEARVNRKGKGGVVRRVRMIVLAGRGLLKPVESVSHRMLEMIGRKDKEEAVLEAMMIVTELETTSTQQLLTVIEAIGGVGHLTENKRQHAAAIKTSWTRMLVNIDTIMHDSRKRFECVGSDRLGVGAEGRRALSPQAFDLDTLPSMQTVRTKA